MRNQEINKYKELKVSSMSQKELIVFLYESSLGLLEDAKETIKLKDVPGTHERLNRARNIFVHLLSTLNVEAGGDFARNLSALYAFFVEKITVANVTKDIQELDDIVPLIKDIKEAWASMNYEETEPAPKNLADTCQAVSLEV